MNLDVEIAQLQRDINALQRDIRKTGLLVRIVYFLIGALVATAVAIMLCASSR